MASKERPVDLLGAVEVLHGYLTPALCEGVFDEVRTGERRRSWTLQCLTEFWTAVILRAPPSLSQALEEASSGSSAYPAVATTPQAFFARSSGLSFEFFERVFERFVEEVHRGEPPRFFAEGGDLRSRFGAVLALDGSSLDPVRRRLKVLWDDPRVVLPGSIVAFYDLSRGSLARLRFESAPQGREPPVAREELRHLPRGALVVADRLFGTPSFLGALTEHGLFGLLRRNRVAKAKSVKRLSRRHVEGGVLEDDVVHLGVSARVEPQTVRRIRLTGRRNLELLTNELDPARLSPQEALSLYARRWSIERLFFELKEVLNLHRFYAANLNAVAAQVYCAAIVHVALRAAQARIAQDAGIEPERISPQRLFPKVAAASAKYAEAERYFDAVCRANPRHRLAKPSWRDQRFASARLATVLVRKRTGVDRKPRPRGENSRRSLPAPPPRPGR